VIPMRVSATAIESFRLWKDPEQEWMTEADLVDTILRRGPSSPAMRLGVAFGSVIESPDEFRVRDGFLADGFKFHHSVMDPVLAKYDRRGLFEVKGYQQYDDVLVVCKADQLLGAQIVETKTTGRFDFEKYAASAQWRLMADTFLPKVITYRVFTVDVLAGDDVDITDTNEFNLFPYAGLHADCEALVEEFRAFVIGKGLDEPLRAFQARMEAA
jgi:hypothetical protein